MQNPEKNAKFALAFSKIARYSMENYQEIWAQMLESIRQRVNQETFESWFKPIVFLGIANNAIEIGVPNSFFCDYLIGHYDKILTSQAKEHFNIDNIDVKIREKSDRESKVETAPAVVDIKKVFNTHLSAEYTFENYVKGDANKFARSVALSIATKPFQTAFNPFFLYGDSGVGKSHLVNAIGLKMLEENPQKRVLYISAHDFLLQYTDSIPKKKFNDFMYFYQSVECLIIDDVHEISGKPGTQEALFNIFNHLQRNGRQIIFTCDKAPSQLEGFEERVSSRFVGGATAEIMRPDEQLRINILKAKIRKNQLSIPQNVILYIAQNVTGNVRDLEGVVHSMLAQSIVHDCDINLAMAQQIVNKYVRFTTKKITIDMILRAVCKYYKVTQRDLNSNSRKGQIVCARQVAMYLTQKHTDMSSTQIGIHIGRRDHSTVLYSCDQVDSKIKANPGFKEEVLAIEQEMVK